MRVIKGTVQVHASQEIFRVLVQSFIWDWNGPDPKPWGASCIMKTTNGTVTSAQ